MRQFTAKRMGMAAAVACGLFALLQLVPYGRHHSNPPVVQEPAWDQASTRELAAPSVKQRLDALYVLYAVRLWRLGDALALLGRPKPAAQDSRPKVAP